MIRYISVQSLLITSACIYYFGNLESTLNLEAVALELEDTEYEPEQFPGLVYRLSDPKVVLLLFGSGKVVCTGAKTKSDAKLGVERAYDRLSELDLI